MADNLLDKASILLTPTAYNDGSMLSVKPNENLYGTELVTNGDFATDTDWTKETGWSISNGLANANSAPNGSSLYQNANLIIGKKYKITYEIKNFVSGQIVARCGNTFGTFNSSNGVFKETLICTSGSNIVIRTSSSTTCSIDNVSVVEDLTGDFTFSRGSAATRVNAQGLVENVQIISSELVSNGDFSQIGTEEVLNGNFSQGSQNWTLTNGTITDKYNASMTAYQSGIKITPFIKTGTFKVVFDLVVTSGSCKFDAGGGNDEIYTTSGTKEKIITNPTKFEFNAFNLGWVGSLDNISVKEVAQDWTSPDYNSALSIVGGQLKIESTVSLGRVVQAVTTVVGKTYLASANITNIDSSTGIQLKLSNGYNLDGAFFTSSFNTTTNIVTIKHYFVATATTTYIGTSQGSSVGQSGLLGNVSVKEITDDTDLPRIDYTDGCGSWLLEPQSTNLVTYSEDFSNSYWTKSSVTLTSGFAAPDGSNNAYKIQGTINTSYIGRLVADTNQRSIYARTVSGTANINLLGDNSGFTVTEDWQRFEYNPTSNTYNFAVDFRNGTNTTEVLIWGAQLEQQSYATSYIPTNGAIATRLADVATNSGNASLINSTEGVLYAEIAALADDLSERRITLSDGSSSNRVAIEYTLSSNQIKGRVVSLGSTSANMNFTLSDITSFAKIAVSYKENDFNLWINGVKVATDTSGNAPIGLSKLSFDNGTGGNIFYGNTKALAVYKEALTDAELQSLTTI